MKKTPPIIYFWSQKLYLTYRWRFSAWKNKHFNDRPWNCLEEWFVYVGWNPALWEREDLYYDGHTVKSITLLGLTIGNGYTYESAAQEDTEHKGPSLTPHND